MDRCWASPCLSSSSLSAFSFWHLLLTRMKLGFNTYMIGSSIEAARYSGVNTRKVVVLVYTLSGAMCAVAGLIMLAPFQLRPRRSR